MAKPIVEVGKRYYIIQHAYHHVVATLQAITGKREGDIVNVVWIHRSEQSWTEFFKKPDWERTTYRMFPNGNCSWIAIYEFPHNIPTKEYPE